MHAPKTDTPARPEIFTMYDHTGAVSVMDADEVRPYIEHLESTLAAERASRVQADTEQFNAGIAKALATCCEQYDAKRAEFEYNIGVHACENAVRRLSKPSVSPEQAEETKR